MAIEKMKTDYQNLITHSASARNLIAVQHPNISIDDILRLTDMSRVNDAKSSFRMACEYARTFGESYFHVAPHQKGPFNFNLTTKAFGSRPKMSDRNNHPDASVNQKSILTYTNQGMLEANIEVPLSSSEKLGFFVPNIADMTPAFIPTWYVAKEEAPKIMGLIEQVQVELVEGRFPRVFKTIGYNGIEAQFSALYRVKQENLK